MKVVWSGLGDMESEQGGEQDWEGERGVIGSKKLGNLPDSST